MDWAEGREVGGNRIKVNLVQIGAFDSRFCTLAQVAVHNRPLHHSLGVRKAANQTAIMPADLNGYWKMISSDNFEEYLKALGEFVAGGEWRAGLVKCKGIIIRALNSKVGIIKL